MATARASLGGTTRQCPQQRRAPAVAVLITPGNAVGNSFAVTQGSIDPVGLRNLRQLGAAWLDDKYGRVEDSWTGRTGRKLPRSNMTLDASSARGTEAGIRARRLR